MDVRKANKKPPNLSIGDFIRIQEIFKSNKWPISGIFDDNYFDNFCEMLAGLSEEQRELILSLTGKFLWVQEHELQLWKADDTITAVK